MRTNEGDRGLYEENHAGETTLPMCCVSRCCLVGVCEMVQRHKTEGGTELEQIA